MTTPTSDSEHQAPRNLYRDRGLSSRVADIFIEIAEPLPAADHIELIGRSALLAQEAFFAAAINEPTAPELRAFFEAFVLSCAGVPFAELSSR